MSPKAVIFDLGRVLVDFDHRIASQKILRYTSRPVEQVYQLFFDSGITRIFEEGRISREDFFHRVKTELGFEFDFADFLPIWNEIFFLTPDNRAVGALAQSLKKNYLTAVLSNINILHYEYLKQAFPVFGPFQKIFASCEMGYVKPDHEIYARALSGLGVGPEEAFYIDDRPELIESARELGIKSVVFRGAEQLRRDLLSAGIVIR